MLHTLDLNGAAESVVFRMFIRCVKHRDGPKNMRSTRADWMEMNHQTCAYGRGGPSSTARRCHALLIPT